MLWPLSFAATPRQSFKNNNNSFSTLSQHSTQRYSQLSDSLSSHKHQKNQDLTQKVNKFISINKRHQLDQVCVCEDCIYAKQLNRYDMLKLDLSKKSTYKAEYNKNLLKRNLNLMNKNNHTIDLSNSTISKKTSDSYISLNRNIHNGSNYSKQFNSKSLDRIQKPRPQDGLKFTGPSLVFSSYKAQYPKHNMPSQYVQPIKQPLLPSLKFTHQSLYSDSYKKSKPLVKTQSQRIPDQLKLGKSSLISQSTNQASFNVPNPQLTSILNKNEKYQQKRLETPNFSYQFKTINANEYNNSNNNVSEKKNCRNKRLQALYGQMLTNSVDLYN